MGTLTGLFEFIKNATPFDMLVWLFILLIFWFIYEKIYYIPKLDGKWEMILLYEKSDYKSYLGMEVHYVLHINQNGTSINIESEKYAEKLHQQQIMHYAPKGKTLGHYYGNVKRGFKNHSLSLNVREQGLIRNVVGSLNLKVISYCQMEGTFEKGDASSSGKVICTKVIQ